MVMVTVMVTVAVIVMGVGGDGDGDCMPACLPACLLPVMVSMMEIGVALWRLSTPKRKRTRHRTHRTHTHTNKQTHQHKQTHSQHEHTKPDIHRIKPALIHTPTAHATTQDRRRTTKVTPHNAQQIRDTRTHHNWHSMQYRKHIRSLFCSTHSTIDPATIDLRLSPCRSRRLARAVPRHRHRRMVKRLSSLVRRSSRNHGSQIEYSIRV